MTDDSTALFDELWDYGKPADTEQRFLELLPQAESSGDASYLIQLLTQLARANGLQRRFDQANELLDRAESLLTPELTVARIRYLLERGRTLNSAGEAERAVPLFLDAWELGLETDQEFYVVDAAHMVAIAADSSEEQLAWNMRAIEAAEGSDNPRTRQWLGSLYNNVGWTYHEMREYDRALAIFQKALKFREEESTPGQAERIRVAKWCVARALRSLDRVEEALEIQLALLEERDAAGEEDGYVFEELGECMLALGREAEGRPYFGKAFANLSNDSWLVSNEPERLRRLEELSKIPSSG